MPIGNLSRAVVAELRKIIERSHNEPDCLPLHVVRLLAQAAKLERERHGTLVATPLGKSMLSDARQFGLPAIFFHLAFWHTDLWYFARRLARLLAAARRRRCASVAIGFLQATGKPARC
jgi:hypothetical protein